MSDHWTPTPPLPPVPGPFPHVFVPVLGGICAVCGLDEDDPDPTRCEHPENVPCGCARAHTPPPPPPTAYPTGVHGPGGPGL